MEVRDSGRWIEFPVTHTSGHNTSRSNAPKPSLYPLFWSLAASDYVCSKTDGIGHIVKLNAYATSASEQVPKSFNHEFTITINTAEC